MNEFIQDMTYFGVMISLVTYFIGVWLKKRLKKEIFNPLLISIILTVVILKIFGIEYPVYYQTGKYLTYLMTPATVCLAVPVYDKIEILKKNYKAVLGGILSGVLTSGVFIFCMSLLLRFSHTEYVTFLPKSITTAIGIGISQEYEGIVSVTVASIVVTGIVGNLLGAQVLKLLKITEPVAKGIALGTASHAFGTVKAMELGEIEGAFSSLSIVIAGLCTVLVTPLFARLM